MTKYSIYSNKDSNSEKFDNGKIVFSLDDNYESHYLKMYPLAIEKGIKFTLFETCVSVGPRPGFGQVTWENLKEMSDSGIVEIGDHGHNHLQFPLLSEAEIIEQFDLVDEEFTLHGIPIPKQLAYPTGDYSVANQAIILADGRRKTARTIKDEWQVYRDSSKLCIGAYGCPATTAGMDLLKARMREVAANKSMQYVYTHGVDAEGDGYGAQIDIAWVEEMIDYGLSLGLDFITHDEAYNLMLKSYIHPTEEFIITGTGTGLGVNTISLKAMTETDIILTGDAYFYTDAAGTLNESQTWHLDNITNYAQTRYLRCNGTGSIFLPTTKLVIWEDWKPVSSNAPAINFPTITGDLGKLVQLRYVLITGNNSLYGDLTNLSKLSTFSIGDQCTCSGSLTGKDMAVLSLPALVTCSADVTEMVNLTSLQSTIDNVSAISGSVSNLSKLIRLAVQGTNTLTGSANGLIMCSYFRVYGTNTIDISSLVNCTRLTYFDTNKQLSSIEINQILADFWTNRDGARDADYTERVIKLATNIYSDEATGQGVIDGAALSTYHSPNNDVANTVWNVSRYYFDKLTITATGDGSAKAYIRVAASNAYMIIEGDAEFNDGSKAWYVAAGGYRANYIKVNSGTAKIRINKGKWTYIVEWTSGVNAPNLSGDIGLITSLVSVSCLGNNTLTGSIATLTALWTFTVGGSNTIVYPNTTNIHGLYSLVVPVTCTLTSENVNQILADFWANRNYAKGGTQRIINIAGNATSGAPTGQGITDKDALKLERSPNPPGTAALWIVTTR